MLSDKKKNNDFYSLFKEYNRFRIIPRLREFKKNARYKIAYGGRGGGKSESVGTLLLEAGYYNKERVLCTREIQDSIKESVYQLLKQKIDEKKLSDFYKVYNDRIVGNNGTEFIFAGLYRNIDKIKSMKGITKCWVEEAHSVSKESLDLLTPTIREDNSEIWFTYNRKTEFDPIHSYVTNPRPDSIIVNINYDDNPYFPDVLYQEMLFDKETNYDLYLHKWEGQPLKLGDYAILSNLEVSEAMNRIITDTGGIEIGVDVARFGNDRTVFFKRKGLKAFDFRIYHKRDTTETTELLTRFIGDDNDAYIKIDDTGIGGAITDNLRKLGKYKNVIPINFNGTAKDEDKYADVISEMWFEFKESIHEIKLPKLEELRAELITREWKQDKKSRRQVESKESYKKKGYKSPDLADACLLCFYNPMKKYITAVSPSGSLRYTTNLFRGYRT